VNRKQLQAKRRRLERNVPRMSLKDAYYSIEEIKRIDTQLDKQVARDVEKVVRKRAAERRKRG
jgi:hypothetical protein